MRRVWTLALSLLITLMTAATSLAAGYAIPIVSAPLVAGTNGPAYCIIQQAVCFQEFGVIEAPAHGYFVCLQVTVENLGQEPFVPADAFDLRLEDPQQNLPGWDPVPWAAQAVSPVYPGLAGLPVGPGESTTGWVTFVVPEGTKGLWYNVLNKVGAAPGKGHTGCVRGLFGDIPGEETIREESPFYKAVLGTYTDANNARMAAAAAREQGLPAWIEAVAPAGPPAVRAADPSVGPSVGSPAATSFIVVVYRSSDRSEAEFQVNYVRSEGFTEAKLVTPAGGVTPASDK